MGQEHAQNSRHHEDAPFAENGGQDRASSRQHDVCVCVCAVQDVADHRRQLEALPDEREGRQEEERLTGEMQGLEKTCQYQDIDMKATVEKLQKIDAEV
jgi:hypothetical protein